MAEALGGTKLLLYIEILLSSGTRLDESNPGRADRGDIKMQPQKFPVMNLKVI